MKLEVLLSTINYNKKNLDKMNITSKCIVINQCDKKGYDEYKNFRIYSFNEKGLSKSRNRGLELSLGDIILLCDDDVVYNDNYEKIVLDEFKKNPKADVIVFNIDSPNRKMRIHNKNKRLRFFNILNYSSPRIAFKKDINLFFNESFGAGAKYNNGEEALFLTEALKKGKRIYSSKEYIGKVSNNKSTWFNGYDKKYFYDKGAILTAINPCIRHILMLQYLIRHPEVLKDYNIIKAYSFMLKGSKEYLNDIRSN